MTCALAKVLAAKAFPYTFLAWSEENQVLVHAPGNCATDIVWIRARCDRIYPNGRGRGFYKQDQYTPEEITEYRKHQAERSQKREYPGDYVYKYVEEDGYAYGYDFEECGARKLFRANDAMELLPNFCYLDYPKLKNTGLRLIRTKSLSKGDSYCNHRFRLGDTEEVPWPPPFVVIEQS